MLGYAFFKFGWAYRLFNYAAILIGVTPPADHPDAAARERAAARAARMNVAAGRHFARGQRAVFFALAYLGWSCFGSLALAATTLFVLAVMTTASSPRTRARRSCRARPTERIHIHRLCETARRRAMPPGMMRM